MSVRPPAPAAQLNRGALGGSRLPLNAAQPIRAHVPLGLLARIRLGVLGGLFLAALFSTLAGIARISLGGDGYEHEFGVSYGRTILIYLTLPFGCVIAGIFAKLFRSAMGAFLLGVVIALPPFLSAAFTIHYPDMSRQALLLIGLGGAVVLGGGGVLLGQLRYGPLTREPPN
jgi:hypothetical protein